MKRSQLDRLRVLMIDYRDAIHRDKMMETAAMRARARREGIAGELADVLAEAGIPDGEGFESGGMVVWYQPPDPESTGRPESTLNYLFLAHYRREG